MSDNYIKHNIVFSVCVKRHTHLSDDSLRILNIAEELKSLISVSLLQIFIQFCI